VLGLGMGSIHKAPEDEIENIIRRAIEHGINYFDLCAGSKKVYKLFGNAIKGQREKVFFPLHFGAVYGETGEYGWSRNPDEILKTIEWEYQPHQRNGSIISSRILILLRRQSK
jgi:aryl-alcohol dehydrogenase-like predicted oxidoreductase